MITAPGAEAKLAKENPNPPPTIRSRERGPVCYVHRKVGHHGSG